MFFLGSMSIGVKYLKHKKTFLSDLEKNIFGCKVMWDITEPIQFIGVTKPKLYLIELISFLKKGSNSVNPCNSF